jgi:hypothetical protein
LHCPIVVGGIEDPIQPDQGEATNVIRDWFVETTGEDVFQCEIMLFVGQSSSGNLFLDSVEERLGGFSWLLLHSKELRPHQALLFQSIVLCFKPCCSGIELEHEICFSGFSIGVVCFNMGADTKLIEVSFGIKLLFGWLLNGCIEDDYLPVHVWVGRHKVEFQFGQELSNGVTVKVPSIEGWRGSHW